MSSQVVYTLSSPWFNKNCEFTPEMVSEFLDLMKNGNFGFRMGGGNVVFLYGLASRGYSNMPTIIQKTTTFLEKMDKLFPDGYCIMTNGDGEYDCDSITTIAKHIAEHEMPNGQPVPVGFIQSSFGYAEPGTSYWPPYASFGLFGPGVRHLFQKIRKGELVYDKQEQPVMAECWGGYVQGPDKQVIINEKTGKPVLSFVDQILFDISEVGLHQLYENVGGFLVAGGGEITLQQMEIHRIGSRKMDTVMVAFDKDKLPSDVNRLAVCKMKNPELCKAWNTWFGKLV